MLALSKTSKRESEGLTQNPARERAKDLLKIQQERRLTQKAVIGSKGRDCSWESDYTQRLTVIYQGTRTHTQVVKCVCVCVCVYGRCLCIYLRSCECVRESTLRLVVLGNEEFGEIQSVKEIVDERETERGRVRARYFGGKKKKKTRESIGLTEEKSVGSGRSIVPEIYIGSVLTSSDLKKDARTSSAGHTDAGNE